MKNNINRITITLAALALVGFGNNASAQVFFPNDATINYPIPSFVIVGYANSADRTSQTNGTSPTVNLVTGGSIQSSFLTYNGSIANISGGTINSSLSASNSSTINLSGGQIAGSLDITDSVTLNLFGTGLSSTLTSPDVDGASQYTLSGLLSDGTDITGKPLYVQNGSNATFHLNNVGGPAVPEPGSIALFVGMATVGGLALRRRKK